MVFSTWIASQARRDIGVEVLAKVSVKCQKLDKKIRGQSEEHQVLLNQVLSSVHKVVLSLSNQLNAQHNRTIEKMPFATLGISTISNNFQLCSDFSFQIGEKLKNRIFRAEQSSSAGVKVPEKPFEIPRKSLNTNLPLLTKLKLMICDLQTVKQSGANAVLYDIERTILVDVWPARRSEYWNTLDIDDVMPTLQKLSDLVLDRKPNNDPVRNSACLLVCITLVVFSDVIFCMGGNGTDHDHKHLINTYSRSTLPLTAGFFGKLFSILLCPDQLQRKVIFEISCYLTTRIAQTAQSKTVELQSMFSLSNNGLLNRYSSGSSVCQTFLKQTEKKMKELQDAKKRELKDLKHEYQQLITTAQSYICTNHTRDCRECNNSQMYYRKARNLDISIHEDKLPTETKEQNITAVEVNMPKSLRAVMAMWARFVHETNTNSKIEVVEKWNEFLSKYEDSVLFLGSTTKSYHSQPFSRPAVSGCSDTNVIKPCGLNQVYVFTKNTESFAVQFDFDAPGPAFCSACTLKLPPQYKSLQFSLDSVGYSQNFVLANQQKCPSSMERRHFVEFASVRADGGRLSVRNVIRVISGNSFPFGDHVTTLFRQATWQVGPLPPLQTSPNLEDEWLTELKSQSFVERACEELTNIVKLAEKNWNLPEYLQVVVVLAYVFAELSTSQNAGKFKELLRFCSNTAFSWLHPIKALRQKDTSIDKQAKLDASIAYCAALMSRSFCPDESWSDSEKIKQSLKLLISSNELYTSTQSNTDTGDAANCCLLGRLSVLKLRPYLIEVIRLQNATLLTQFVCAQWANATPGSTTTWVNYENSDWWWATFSGNITVQVNITSGELLISGSPLLALPREVLENSTVRKLLNGSNLRVQPEKVDKFSCEITDHSDLPIVIEFEIVELQ